MLKVVAVHLEKLGLKYATVDGSVNPKQRMDVVEEFNNTPQGPQVRKQARETKDEFNGADYASPFLAPSLISCLTVMICFFQAKSTRIITGGGI